MSKYFKTLNAALQQANFALPMLMIDQERLDANLALVKKMLTAKVQPRLVVKSLGSIELITYITNALSCNHFMVFHLPHLPIVLNTFPHADILFGKPMPIAAVRTFYEQACTNPQTTDAQIQWLIDSNARLEQYLEFAKTANLRLSVNIEIDIGLHRGGISNMNEFKSLLKLIDENPHQLHLSGFMGYDAHVGKIPTAIKSVAQSYQQSQQHYQQYIDCLKNDFPTLYHPALCFNSAGSPTFSLHAAQSVCNDLSFGSMLLKPTDFDLPTLEHFQPAFWIATPVLKKLNTTQIPGLEILNRLHSKEALFVYGGNWMAKYVYPEGAKTNALYGRSSNQELVNIPSKSEIEVDDFVFLRPTQSEAIISQFEQIWLYHDQQFTRWTTFRS
jgi:D-serine deaminase-like pyridoxal phosphate-dependent protein